MKLRKIAGNPYAALNLNCDDWGREVVVLIGEIREDLASLPLIQNKKYLEKYRASISEGLQMMLESFSQKYSVPLRFTPERIRVF